MTLAAKMLDETRKIESALVQKLNCMYFVARKVSLPSVENMLKKEKQTEDAKNMYLGFSKQLNDLLNLYFSVENELDIELTIAGNEEEKRSLMPLLYIDSERNKAELISEIKMILKEYTRGQKDVMLLNPLNRMKPLDVTKVLMGIRSSRENVKRFENDNRVWARR